jgi:peptidylprolyl isomerase
MNSKQPILSRVARLLVLPLAVSSVLLAACSANVVVITPSPAPAASAAATSAPATGAASTVPATGAASGNVSAAADSGQSPCLGVADPTTNPPAGGSAKQWTAPANVVDVTHTYCAIIKTEKGRIVAELFPQAAPKNTNSFVFLAQQGFYDGVTFHRVITGFMAQTGDPTGSGSGGPGYNNLPLEVSPSLKYDREGRIGMARTNDPNSAGSQFFITVAAYPSLDQGGYTIIGQVVEGMTVVKQITPRDPQAGTGPSTGDKLASIRIVDLGPKK